MVREWSERKVPQHHSLTHRSLAHPSTRSLAYARSLSLPRAYYGPSLTHYRSLRSLSLRPHFVRASTHVPLTHPSLAPGSCCTSFPFPFSLLVSSHSSSTLEPAMRQLKIETSAHSIRLSNEDKCSDQWVNGLIIWIRDCISYYWFHVNFPVIRWKNY